MAAFKEQADALAMAGSYDEALTMYKEAQLAAEIAEDTEVLSKVLSNRSAALVQLSRYEDALVDTTRLMELRPDWPKAYLRHGGILFCQQKFKEAAQSYALGLQYSPNDETLHANLMNALRAQEQAALTSEVHMWGKSDLCFNAKEAIAFRYGKSSRMPSKGEDLFVPYPVLAQELSGVPVRQVDLGRYHGAMLTVAGEVYTWGNGFLCGLAEESPSMRKELAKANSTEQFSFASALFKDSAFFHDTPTLVIIPKRKRISRIAVGEYHTMALAECGTVYAWGANFSGALGYGTTPANYHFTPRKIGGEIEGLRVTQIACGLVHSVVLTEGGEVYTFGANNQGQLGHGFAVTCTKSPQRVASLSGAVSISAARRHTAVALATGSVYTFGGNYRGCLGYVPNMSLNLEKFTADNIVISLSSLASSLSGALKSGVFADLTVFAAGEPFSVHKCILAARSEAAAAVIGKAPITEISLIDLLLGMAGKDANVGEVSATVDAVTTAMWQAFAEFLYGNDDPLVQMYRKNNTLTKKTIDSLCVLFGLSKVGQSMAVFSEKGSLARLQKDLGKVLASGQFADVSICTGEDGTEELAAHRVILAARSPYFRAMLDSGMSEAQEGKISFPHESTPVMTDLLTFIYTDALKINAEQDEEAGDRVVQLLGSACTYGLFRLSEALERTIAASVDVTNLLSILQFAEQLGTPQLFKFCMLRVIERMPDIEEEAEYKALPAELRETISTEFKEVTLAPAETGNNECQALPRRVPNMYGKNVVMVCCADKFTVALDSGGYLYMWGVGSHPKWKCMPNASPLIAAHHVPFSERIIDIACGSSHVLALAASGRVYAWGSGYLGQTVSLKEGSTLLGYSAEPGLVSNVPAETIACGHSSSAMTRAFTYDAAEGESSLTADLLRMVGEGTAHNLTLVAPDGHTRRVHQCVAACRSEILAKLAKDAKDGKVPVSLGKEDLNAYVNYLYGNITPEAAAVCAFDPAVPSSSAAPSGIPMGRSFVSLARAEAREDTDLVLQCEGEGGARQFYCHTDVFCARSEFLPVLMQSKKELTRDADGRLVIDLGKVSSEAVQQVLRYIYCDEDAVAMDCVEDVACVTTVLLIPRLRFRMQLHLARQIGVDNAISLLALAASHHLVYLKEICVRYTRRNLAHLRGLSGYTDLPVDLRQLCES